MTIISYRPENAWLKPKLDGRWWRWFLASLAYGGLLACVLISAALPRQERVRLAYEIAKLREETAALEREVQQLELEKHRLLAPSRLAQALPELGLRLPRADQVLYLTPQGELVTAGSTKKTGGQP